MRRLFSILILLCFSALSLSVSFAAPNAVTAYGLGMAGQFNSLGLYNGTPFISFIDDNNDDLRVAICQKNCGLPTAQYTTQILDSVGSSGFATSLAMFSNRPYISYISNGDLKVTICTSVCTILGGLYVTNTVDNSHWITGQTSLGLFGARLMVSYYDGYNKDLWYAVCSANCATSQPTYYTSLVDSVGDVGEYNALAIFNDSPTIAYYDRTNGNLKIVRCSANCLTSKPTWVRRNIDNTGDVGLYPDIAMTSLGNPIISYFDFTKGNLKLATCTVNCTTTSQTYVIHTIADKGTAGEYASLALVGDAPVVSYYDRSNEQLKIAVCTTNCATTNPSYAIQSLAKAGGTYTSVAINGGLPVVSYYDWTNMDLNVATCDTPTCGGGTGIVEFAPATALNVNESAGTINIPVTLTVTGGTLLGSTTINLTFTGTALKPSDFTTVPAALLAFGTNLAPGTYTKFIQFTVVKDTLVEGNESVTIQLTNASDGIALGTGSSRTFTIIDGV